MATATIRHSQNGRTDRSDTLGQLSTGSVRRHRRWPRVGAASALAVLCGAMFVLLYGSAGSRHPYLAVGRPIAVGATITASDLVTARVAKDPVLSPIPSDEVASVVGRRAAVALVPGTLLTAGDLASGSMLGVGQASVGLDLKPGEAPAGLGPGDSVVVIETAGSGSGSPLVNTTPVVLTAQSTVLSVQEPTATASNGDTEITLAVQSDEASQIASASAAGQVAIAGLGGTGQ